MMPKLYVANCTKQRHDFVFRSPEEDQTKSRILTMTIGVGEQAVIWRDAPLAELDRIIQQKLVFGMRPASELYGAREFVGLCYEIDRPVDIDRVVHAVKVNDQHLEAVSAKVREESAVALNNEIDRIDPNNLRSLEVEIEELPKRGETSAARKGKETIQVVRPGVEPRNIEAPRRA